MARSLLALACIHLVTGVWSEDAPETPVYNEKFSTSLLKELATSGGNLVFSPLSIDTAMSIVGFGAKDTTMNEIFGTLGYPPEQAKQLITEKQKKINEAPAPGAIWQAANRLMIDPEIPVKESYKKEVAQSFPGTAIGAFNFEQPEDTANEVNSWVADKTNNVIKKLLNKEDVKESTKMMVLNAVYFKGQWKHGFDKKRTRQECFYSEPGKCTKTDFMFIKEDFKYGYDSDMKAQIIELPYKNEDFSMIIVLPHEKESNLTSLLANLDVEKVLKFIDGRKWKDEVNVQLPKFEIEFKKELKGDLIKLGMKDVFTPKSDLSGMVAGLRAKVDSVIHKAKITVDEEGTVAAAATGLGIMAMSSLRPRIHYFTADRPYLYMINRHKAGVLFSGTYSVPEPTTEFILQ